MLRSLYQWTMSLAANPHAEKALFGVSLAESSLFPVPPDALLIPMVIARPFQWLRLAAICTIASVIGAYVGYAIGMFLYELIGEPILSFYGKQDSFDRISHWYAKWGGWGVFLAAITPFPYKVLTIFSGATGLNIFLFGIVSVVGRAARFFLVAGLLRLYGHPMRLFIERYLGILTLAFCLLLIGGFYLFTRIM
jgi:membrane protein YqaA with SNARE-associated domain